MLSLDATRPPARDAGAGGPCGPWTVSTPSLGVQVSVAGDLLVVGYATDGALGPAAQALFLPVQWDEAGRCRVVAPGHGHAMGRFDALYVRAARYPDRAYLAGPVHEAFTADEWRRLAGPHEVLVLLLHPQVPRGNAAADAPEQQQVERYLAGATASELRRGRIGAGLLAPPGPALALSFALASCQYPGNLLDRTPAEARLIGPADASMCRLAGRLDQPDPPTLLVLAGDQIYADATAGLFDLPRDEERYRHAYQQRAASRGPQALAGRLQQQMLMDDHEVEADWEFEDAAGRARMQAARSAYWQWQRLGDPRHEPRALWTPLRYRGFDFFMGDCRSEREPRQADDLAQRHIMQAPQRAALEDWLLAVRGRPHFVATSSMLLPRRLATACQPAAAVHSDAWDGYPASLHGLLAHLCDHALDHTVFLSGDEHVGCVARVHIERLSDAGRVLAEATCHSVHTPALYAPYPFANSLAEHFADDEVFEFSRPGHAGLRRYRCTVQTWRPAVGDGFVVLRLARGARGGWQVRATFDHAGGQQTYEIALPA
ncbi:MAG TPA: alkaline phosphatase D family protein [Burkholderiaceae bacterium]|nr:alkaline phosphatase D family protein [Burkholderiaceae bacterium]